LSFNYIININVIDKGGFYMKVTKAFIVLSLLLLLTGCPNPHPWPIEDKVNVLINSEVQIDVLNNDDNTDYPDSLQMEF